MADDTPKHPGRRRTFRILRAIGLVLLGLVLLIMLLIGGALLFARTDTGQRWITGKINDVLSTALAPSGLNAHFDTLTGSLPSSLGFEGLTVSDADGPWLSVDKAQLNMGWSALRKHRLVVRSVRVEHPVVARLPHLAERPQNEPEQPIDPLALLAKLADWPDWMPALAVENVDVNSLTLGPDVAGEAMILSLHGSASASAQSLQAGLSLRRDDKPGAEQAEVHAALTPDALLTLSLALAETPDGLLARALPREMVQAPALRFLLQGSAPLADWKGDLSLDVLETDTKSMSGASLNDRTVLALKGVIGATPLAASPGLSLNLTASTGKASTGLWRMAGQKDGKAVAHLTARATLDRPVAMPDARSRSDGAATVNAQGRLSLDMSDMEWADPRLVALAGPNATLGTDFAVVWRGGSPDTATTEAGGGAGLDATVHALALQAGALSAHGSAAWHLADGNPLAAASALDLNLTAGIADATDLDMPDFATTGPLTAHLTAAGPMSALNAELTLDGKALTVRGESLERPHLRLTAADLNLSAVVADLAVSPASGTNVLPSSAFTATTGGGVLEAGVRVRGQDVDLKTRWEVTPGPDVLTAAVRDLSLRAAGLQVDGDLSAALPTVVKPAEAPPSSAGMSKEALPVLTGTLRADVTDWNVLSGLTGLPLNGGKASLSLNLAPGADGQTADADLNVDHLRVGATDGAAPISLTALRGSIQVEDALHEPRLDANISGDRVQADGVDLRAIRLTARGSLSGPLDLAVQSEGDVAARAEASWKPGEVAVQSLRLRLSERFMRAVQPTETEAPRGGACPPPTSRGKPGRAATAAPVGPWGVRLSHPAIIRYGSEGFSTPGLDLELEPSGTVHLSGALNAQSLKLNGRIDKLDLGLFRPLVPALPEGRVQAEITLNGTPARPGGGLILHLDGLRAPGSLMPPVSCTLEGTLERASGGGVLNARLTFPPAALTALGASRAEASLLLPLVFTADGLPRPAPRGALRGEAQWEGDLAPLWNFLPLADRRLTGRGSLLLEAGGSLERPELSGQARINGAEYDDLVLGVLLTGINASVDLDKGTRSAKTPSGLMAALGQARLSLQAGDGMGGTLALDGTLAPATMTVDAKGGLNDLKPLRRQDMRISLSGDASVTGTVTAPAVKAAITVNQGELLLTDLPGGSIAVLPISDAGHNDGPAADSPVGSLDVEITVPNRFFVRGHGLDSDWQGQVRAEGPLNAPSVVGNLRAVRGSLDLLNRNFTLSKGVITFDGGHPINPQLDIVMTYNAANFMADVTVSGTASHPEVALSSKPSMPQDEIIAQVMFGRSAGKLGRLETLQLAGAAAALAGFGNGGGGVFDLARKSLGVDVLRLGSSNDGESGLGGSTLEVGKYVNDKVYVGVSQGLDASGTGAVVNVDLTRHTSLEARTDSTKSEVGVEWSYDY